MAKRDPEYYRSYRATKSEMQESRDQELVRSGIDKCIKYMREKIAGQAITGFRAALMIERAMLEIEPQEVTARRQFIAALQREAKS